MQNQAKLREPFCQNCISRKSGRCPSSVCPDVAKEVGRHTLKMAADAVKDKRSAGKPATKRMDIQDKGLCTLGDEAYSGVAGKLPVSLAMVYSPEQYWGQLYTPEEGLERGTLFEGLYKPWQPDCKEDDR